MRSSTLLKELATVRDTYQRHFRDNRRHPMTKLASVLTAPTTDTAPTLPAPEPTILQKLKDAFAIAGKPVDATAAVKLRDAFIAANITAEKLEKECAEKLALVRSKRQEAATALISATGGQPLRFGGVLYEPGCKGGALFYKVMKTREALDLG